MNTPLHFAARQGDLESCRLLIEKGSSLTAKNLLGEMPMHLSINEGVSLEVFRLLERQTDRARHSI